eukprot:349620-Chlamydomonas_euryale.AAC.6
MSHTIKFHAPIRYTFGGAKAVHASKGLNGGRGSTPCCTCACGGSLSPAVTYACAHASADSGACWREHSYVFAGVGGFHVRWCRLFFVSAAAGGFLSAGKGGLLCPLMWAVPAPSYLGQLKRGTSCWLAWGIAAHSPCRADGMCRWRTEGSCTSTSLANSAKGSQHALGI